MECFVRERSLNLWRRAGRLYLLVLILLGGSSRLFARSPVVMGHSTKIDSKILSEERELLIYLPNGYGAGSASDKYPVLYVLDGRSCFKHTAGIVHGLSESGGIPRMIVVGIANTNRWRDLTPTATLEHEESGGGEIFLRFLRDEVLPHITATYRVSNYRIFAGHSLGGLMVLQALMTMSETFQGYIAQSPSLEWDESFVSRFEGFLSGQESLPKQIHLSLGDERATREPFRRLVGVFDFKAPSDADWDWFIDDEENHMTVRLTSTLRGIQSIYRDWNLTSEQIVNMSIESVDAHYESASKQYDSPRTLPLGPLVEAGYFAIYHKRSVSRGLELFALAVERFPASPYSHDSLGEGFEHAGRLEEALAKYKQATRMAKALREPDLGYYYGHLDRVTKKLDRSESEE